MLDHINKTSGVKDEGTDTALDTNKGWHSHFVQGAGVLQDFVFSSFTPSLLVVLVTSRMSVGAVISMV